MTTHVSREATEAFQASRARDFLPLFRDQGVGTPLLRLRKPFGLQDGSIQARGRASRRLVRQPCAGTLPVALQNPTRVAPSTIGSLPRSQRSCSSMARRACATAALCREQGARTPLPWLRKLFGLQDGSIQAHGRISRRPVCQPCTGTLPVALQNPTRVAPSAIGSRPRSQRSCSSMARRACATAALCRKQGVGTPLLWLRKPFGLQDGSIQARGRISRRLVRQPCADTLPVAPQNSTKVAPSAIGSRPRSQRSCSSMARRACVTAARDFLSWDYEGKQTPLCPEGAA
jgi:hypothetical protein